MQRSRRGKSSSNRKGSTKRTITTKSSTKNKSGDVNQQIVNIHLGKAMKRKQIETDTVVQIMKKPKILTEKDDSKATLKKKRSTRRKPSGKPDEDDDKPDGRNNQLRQFRDAVNDYQRVIESVPVSSIPARLADVPDGLLTPSTSSEVSQTISWLTNATRELNQLRSFVAPQGRSFRNMGGSFDARTTFAFVPQDTRFEMMKLMEDRKKNEKTIADLRTRIAGVADQQTRRPGTSVPDTPSPPPSTDGKASGLSIEELTSPQSPQDLNKSLFQSRNNPNETKRILKKFVDSQLNKSKNELIDEDLDLELDEALDIESIETVLQQELMNISNDLFNDVIPTVEQEPGFDENEALMQAVDQVSAQAQTLIPEISQEVMDQRVLRQTTQRTITEQAIQDFTRSVQEQITNLDPSSEENRTSTLQDIAAELKEMQDQIDANSQVTYKARVKSNLAKIAEDGTSQINQKFTESQSNMAPELGESPEELDESPEFESEMGFRVAETRQQLANVKMQLNEFESNLNGAIRQYTESGGSQEIEILRNIFTTSENLLMGAKELSEKSFPYSGQTESEIELLQTDLKRILSAMRPDLLQADSLISDWDAENRSPTLVGLGGN